MVAVSMLMSLFAGLKAGIFPVPEAGKPIEGELFVQVNWVVATDDVKLIAAIAEPLHTV